MDFNGKKYQHSKMHTGIKSQIISLSRADPLHEVCGFIYRDWNGGPQILPCQNVATDPTEEFEISIDDSIRVQGLGRALAVYHSHPSASPGFSPADLECAEEMALPFYLYDVETETWHEYIPKSYESEFLGRQWCVGFDDCYSVPRNYFRKIHGIYLRDYDRDESMSHEERGVIAHSYEREGFSVVPKETIQEGDVLVFKTDKALPQHFGVYAKGNQFIHHPINGLSRLEPFSERWFSRLISVFRHKSMVKSAQNPCNP